MAVPATTLDLINRLSTTFDGPTGIKVKAINNLGVFIDTHRDHPHVGSFHADIHRGECRPTNVHVFVAVDAKGQQIARIMNADTGQTMDFHPKHLFVSTEWYENWFMNWFMEHGSSPVDDEGKMPTSHFRDPRAKTYVLKTLGHLVRERATKEGLR